ncbi:histidine utilization repressor [Labrys monachus]|uniref:Histidine utilization repressor n=1 Tax=Labrys monachus TaxID=217067 RepID=A0ABU0FJ08_9HYPH|nr:histidine utilization repressor [Labrys monachus]MDQ0394603.1 GntR family histidine utilization transcriptional repressor [Labrys monachus]
MSEFQAGGAPAGATTLHQRILGDLEARIVSGEWPPGHRIPFEVELTERYRCSRMTVNKALTQLAASGLIERRRKAGSFVARPRSEAAVLAIHSIEAEVGALGLPYRFDLVRRQEQPETAADRLRLRLDDASRVIALTCRHFAGEAPFCLEERLVNVDAVPPAADADFAREPPGAWLTRHIPWTVAEHHIQAVAVRGETAAMLGLDGGTACLVVERRTWRGEQTVTAVRFTYPGDRHQLVARFSPS